MPYYTPITDFTPYTKATSSDLDAEFNLIETGFGLLPSQARMDSGNTNYVVAGGTANALTITSPGTAITTYTGQDGLAFSVKATATNTGATTVNIDGVGAVSLVASDGSTPTASSITTNGIYTVVYNETTGKFVFADPLGSEAAASASAAAAAASEAAAAASAAGVNLPSIAGGDALKHLRANAGETGYELQAEVAAHVDYQEFTSSGTWTKPANAISIYVECIGGGGGGGNHTGSSACSGGGGGGFTSQVMAASSAGATESITIGAGGSGAASGTALAGLAGGDSSMGAIVVADGAIAAGSIAIGGFGGGGEPGGSQNNGSAGGGYSSGGGGYIGNAAGNCVKGGAGGGSTNGATEYAGGVSREGGDGGAGIGVSSTQGEDGIAPGGGGGGSSYDGGGGDGADGRVRIWTMVG